jgi:hypothetical protein
MFCVTTRIDIKRKLLMSNRLRFLSRSLLLLLVLSVAVAAPAVAERGGKGNGHGGAGGGTGAAIVFDPAQVALGATYQVKGSGFKPNTWVTVGAHYADTTWWTSGVTDGQGGFSLTMTARSPGEIMHEASEMTRNGQFRFKASASLTVS